MAATKPAPLLPRRFKIARRPGADITSMSFTKSALLRLYDLQLQSLAANYDIRKKPGRLVSVRALTRLFFDFAKALQPEVFIEAGAKDGKTSIKMREILPTSTIIAFEANPHNFEHYSSRLDHGRHRVEYLNLALTNRPGSVPFYIKKTVAGEPVPPTTGRNSLHKAVDDSAIEYEEISVAGTTLDQFFTDRIASSCGLWVDVEGANRELLTGGAATLERALFILIEVSDKSGWQDTWQAYEVSDCLFDHGLLPVARDFQSVYQYNVLFARDEALLDPEVRRAVTRFFARRGQFSRSLPAL